MTPRASFVSVLLLAALTMEPVSHAQRRRRRLPDFDGGPRSVSMYGGQSLGSGRSAIAAGGLYPGIFFQYSAGLSDRFDLGFRGDLLWGSPYASSTIGYGVQLALPMRLQLGAGRRAFFAFRISPDLVFGSFSARGGGCRCVARNGSDRCVAYDCDDDLWDDGDRQQGFGMGCDLGLNVGIPVRAVNIVFGVTSPIHFVLLTEIDRTDVYFPIAPYGGAEIRLTQRLNVFGLGQFGINLHWQHSEPRTDSFLRLWGGIEYAL